MRSPRVPQVAVACFDDVYLDDTWARMEIGDRSDFDICPHRESQPPTAWSSTDIAATLNQGSFAAQDEAWLFVVDRDANVSGGYSMVIEG